MPSASRWCFGAFRLDAATTCLWRQGQLLRLAPKPLAVLVYLVAHAGEVVTKDELLEAVWPETVVSEGVLKTCIGRIRQVLGGRRGHYSTLPPSTDAAIASLQPLTVLEPSASAPAAMPRALPSSAGRRAQAPQTFAAAAALMVARDSELVQHYQCWAQALQGRRQGEQLLQQL